MLIQKADFLDDAPADAEKSKNRSLHLKGGSQPQGIRAAVQIEVPACASAVGKAAALNATALRVKQHSAHCANILLRKAGQQLILQSAL